MALGATMSLPEKDDYHMRKTKLKAMLVHLLAGRTAEVVCCGDISAGAENDIRRATHIARLMVAEMGMSEKIGTVSYTRVPEHNFLGRDFSFGKEYSEKIAYEIDTEVKAFLKEAYDQAMVLCRDNKDKLEKITEALMERESLTGQEVKQLIDGEELAPLPQKEENDDNGDKEGGTGE